MCLLLIAVRAVPGKPLLLLANRDEFRARASATAEPWKEDPRVVGGHDLVAGGSWLAVRADGRYAAVTNVRSGLPATAPKSRGWLVRDFVLGDTSPRDFVDALHADVESYGAFNLVVGDRESTWAYGTADSAPREARCRRARDQQWTHRRALAEDRAPATTVRRRDFGGPRYQRCTPA